MNQKKNNAPLENEPPLLEVKDYSLAFTGKKGSVSALREVTFDIKTKEVVALVGESGSGKSITCLSIMKLLPMPPARRIGGSIRFRQKDGTICNVAETIEKHMRKIRGSDIAMIFQEPMTSLNPVHTVGNQIAEAVIIHHGKSRKQALDITKQALHLVGIPDPERRIYDYPHQLSGGMRQRVMIAMALSCGPRLLIADEPTTALDVTIQAQILELILQLQNELGMAVLYITHDFGVVAEVAERVLVMYAGQIVEEGDVVTVLKESRHPYTAGLLRCIPKITDTIKHGTRLRAIQGKVPDLTDIPFGCAFHPRCFLFRSGLCDVEVPSIHAIGGGRRVRCFRWNETFACLK
jgi:oligopeptide transport system ATP-binding protein